MHLMQRRAAMKTTARLPQAMRITRRPFGLLDTSLTASAPKGAAASRSATKAIMIRKNPPGLET
eukprot:CAMPEP_0197660202 /NCGR_PEP_ID=MMETSP1338-20131121/50708_1 /TAXON_ID=43686 ORGANISM="Pelagodinium beii, Strain RCC1491" /NCGR_SAMPLE_ID=MMETSP1338 /ASSEMBLY_ACC=CAM_ASM_000754 /LENGTH=63 /DNA_ID=CAMNT_0043237509 /DNA_START=157 /DNA_END=344 /DNA_ORIENTATION=-